VLKRILFVCQYNSGRSIIAEAITNSLAPKKFRAYSAGLENCGPISELLLDLLREKGHSTEHLKVRSVDHFTGLMAVKLDYVITTCDPVTAEACPVWPGQPAVAHWNIAKPEFRPGDVTGNRQLLEKLYARIYTTVNLFISLPEDVRGRMEVDGGISRLHEEARLAG
jgi:arsenate reductase (thioredoxin)